MRKQMAHRIEPEEPVALTLLVAAILVAIVIVIILFSGPSWQWGAPA